MRLHRLAAVAGAVLMIASCAAAAARPSASGTTLVDIGAGLQGPSGLAASIYAQGLSKASAFAFDAQSRLWVATADYTDAGEDGVYLVASSGATPIEVISGLHTPLGLLWYEDALYVSSKGGVTAYSGFDGVRFARHRTILALPGDVGEVNGMVLSPEGRIWMGISAPSDHSAGISEYSASVVSFLPDGSDLKVEASGIRAPIGFAYYPGTSDLLVTMNQRDDLGQATPGDWLAVVAEGQAWGFPDCYGQGGTACSGVPQPTAVLDKHGAVSGLAIVTGQLGKTVGTSAIVAEWAAGKVQRVPLAKAGSTYTGTVEPFLTGLTNPVALIVAPDGGLLVGDWTSGTVFRVSASTT